MSIKEAIEFIGGTHLTAQGAAKPFIFEFDLEGKTLTLMQCRSQEDGDYVEIFSGEDDFCVEGLIEDIILQLPRIMRNI